MLALWFILFALVFLLLPRPKRLVGTASLMRKPHQIDTWIRHHKNIGVSKIYIYWDDTETPLPTQDDIVHIFRLTPEFLKENNYNEVEGMDNAEICIEKQKVIVDHALGLGEVEWVFHIDADELLYPESGNIESVFKEVTEDVDSCVVTNFELAPDHENYKNCFVEGTKFRRGANMVAYGNGKSCGRTGSSRSNGPHRCISLKGGSEYEFPDSKLKLLHYVSCNLDEYMKKYEWYGNFKDDIWGWAEHHRKSRDVLSSCESKESCTLQAREMFLEQRPPKPDESLIEIKRIEE